jgi:hypothetical protein
MVRSLYEADNSAEGERGQMIVNPQGTKPVTAQPEQAVKRNAGRFPEDFMFVLTPQGFAEWRSQFVTSKADRMGPRHAPMAFTEQRARRASSQWWGADRAGLDRRGETNVNLGNDVPETGKSAIGN